MTAFNSLCILPKCQEEVAVLVRALAGVGKTPVNLGQLLNVRNTNSLGRVMLGRRRVFSDGRAGGDPKADEFKEMVVELTVPAGVFNLADFIPALDRLDLQGVARKMTKLHSRFDSFLNQILEEHKANGGTGTGSNGAGAKHVDLLSTLILLKDDVDGEGGKLTDTEIKALLLVNI